MIREAVEPEKKSDAVRRLVKERSFKEALRIAKDFRLGITREQAHAMQMAYECMVHPAFYRAVNINPEEAISTGTSVLLDLYSS